MRLDEMLIERIQALADGYFPAPEGSEREEGPRRQFVSYAQWRANQVGIKSPPGISDGIVPSVHWFPVVGSGSSPLLTLKEESERTNPAMRLERYDSPFRDDDNPFRSIGTANQLSITQLPETHDEALGAQESDDNKERITPKLRDTEVSSELTRIYGRLRGLPQPKDGPSNDAVSPLVFDERRRITQDYSARFQHECAKVLRRLCPEGDTPPDWNEADILDLNTIFRIARVAHVAGSDWLDGRTIVRVIEKLTTFKADRRLKDPVNMERHFRLLAAVLRLYQYRNFPLDHVKLFKTIQELADSFEANRRNWPQHKQIENGNVAFLINHCQSLIFSINDLDIRTTSLARRATGIIDAGLSVYGGQWVKANRHLREMITRGVPKWHAEFVKLEDLCFSLFAESYKLYYGESAGESIASPKDELEVIYRLCDVLEEMVVENDLQSGWGRGVYDQYFHFGVMDLMMQMTYHVKDRRYCFKEFVHVVKTTLEGSHPKANPLHRKAVDLYRKIIRQGELDKVRYGGDKDIAAIRTWIKANEAYIEKQDESYRCIVIRFIINV